MRVFIWVGVWGVVRARWVGVIELSGEMMEMFARFHFDCGISGDWVGLAFVCVALLFLDDLKKQMRDDAAGGDAEAVVVGFFMNPFPEIG
jgi:hypothetical protein